MNRIIKFTDIENVNKLNGKTILNHPSYFDEETRKVIPSSAEIFGELSETILDSDNSLTEKGIGLINKHEFNYLYTLQEVDISREHKKIKFKYILRGFKK